MTLSTTGTARPLGVVRLNLPSTAHVPNRGCRKTRNLRLSTTPNLRPRRSRLVRRRVYGRDPRSRTRSEPSARDLALSATGKGHPKELRNQRPGRLGTPRPAPKHVRCPAGRHVPLNRPALPAYLHSRLACRPVGEASRQGAVSPHRKPSLRRISRPIPEEHAS